MEATHRVKLSSESVLQAGGPVLAHLSVHVPTAHVLLPPFLGYSGRLITPSRYPHRVDAIITTPFVALVAGSADKNKEKERNEGRSRCSGSGLLIGDFDVARAYFKAASSVN